jgi:small subunit ribosomal protein S9
MATAKKTYTYALGRRKSATARVRLYKGKGDITINTKTAVEYFGNSQKLLERISQPLVLLDKNGQFDISVKVAGGGNSGQADAIRSGIAKALVIINEEFKATLKKADLLGRDSRERERKKFGFKSARKQRQFTKR